MSGRPKQFTNMQLENAIREHELPFITAKELAEKLDVSNSAINSRLEKLEKEGSVESKKVGARAKVWWIAEEKKVDAD
jgi:predicted ArsR family transcriptional regulator